MKRLAPCVWLLVLSACSDGVLSKAEDKDKDPADDESTFADKTDATPQDPNAPAAGANAPCPKDGEIHCFDETQIRIELDTNDTTVDGLMPTEGALDAVTISFNATGVSTTDSCLVPIAKEPDDRSIHFLEVEVSDTSDAADSYSRTQLYNYTCNTKSIVYLITGVPPSASSAAGMTFHGKSGSFFGTGSESFIQTSSKKGTGKFNFNTAEGGQFECPTKAIQGNVPCYEGMSQLFIIETEKTALKPKSAVTPGEERVVEIKISPKDGIKPDESLEKVACLEAVATFAEAGTEALVVDFKATPLATAPTTKGYELKQIFRYKCDLTRLFFEFSTPEAGLTFDLNVVHHQGASTSGFGSGNFTSAGHGSHQDMLSFKVLSQSAP